MTEDQLLLDELAEMYENEIIDKISKKGGSKIEQIPDEKSGVVHLTDKFLEDMKNDK